MNVLLVLAYLFFIGSVFGWIIELLWRNIFSKSKKWINPGFCTGPYLPLYGFGLCALFLLATLEKYFAGMSPFWSKIILFIIMALVMTLIEYLSGIFSLKYLKVRLWDYSDCWGNIQGIICPLYSFFWALLGGVYYFAIHPHILSGLTWLSKNLAFSFFIGMFFGIFIIDVVNSAQLVVKLKKFAEEHSIVLVYDKIKEDIKRYHEENDRKYHFFSPFKSGKSLSEHLMNIKKNIEDRININERE
ncbi:MAG: putative ABC transporter permease [Eubacteriales bacterium]|nr:putative ABC transporter permease [Eubacteriales bacterium]